MLSGEYVRKLNKKFEQVQELATKKQDSIKLMRLLLLLKLPLD